jgi:tRNA A-37 threonylcarbamoyl transferase component Bud32
MHTDCSHEEGVLVYPYFQSTLLSLIQDDLELPTEGRMKILRQVGEAIQELHNKDWIHIGSFLTPRRPLHACSPS